MRHGYCTERFLWPRYDFGHLPFMADWPSSHLSCSSQRGSRGFLHTSIGLPGYGSSGFRGRLSAANRAGIVVLTPTRRFQLGVPWLAALPQPSHCIRTRAKQRARTIPSRSAAGCRDPSSVQPGLPQEAERAGRSRPHLHQFVFATALWQHRTEISGH